MMNDKEHMRSHVNHGLNKKAFTVETGQFKWQMRATNVSNKRLPSLYAFGDTYSDGELWRYFAVSICVWWQFHCVVLAVVYESMF